MLKFLTQRINTEDNYSYYFRFYVQADFTSFDVQKNTKYYVNKLRETLLEINQTLPRFTEAKWYTPMPFMDKKYDPEADLNTVSLSDDPDKFIAEVLKENKDSEGSVNIYHVWDGIHPVKYPAYFFYGHNANNEHKYIAFGDSLDLQFYMPNNFDYSKDWTFGFSLEELEQIITIVNRHYNIIHADLHDGDFIIRSAPENASENYYEDSYQVFPHRFGATWMTVIDKQLTSEQVPEAAKVVPLEKGRTLLMSVSDNYFDSYNPEHVLKANLLELRLQHLGVLRSSFAIE